MNMLRIVKAKKSQNLRAKRSDFTVIKSYHVVSSELTNLCTKPDDFTNLCKIELNHSELKQIFVYRKDFT